MDDNKIIPMLGADEENVCNSIAVDSPLAVLPLRGAALFPSVVIPINLGRKSSVALARWVYAQNKQVAVAMQKDAKMENPSIDDIHSIGTAASIVRIVDMPDGTTTIILQGLRRIALQSAAPAQEQFMMAHTLPLIDTLPIDDTDYDAAIVSIKEVALRIVQNLPQQASEASNAIRSIANRTFLVNYLASNIELPAPDKQRLLETSDAGSRAALLLELLLKEEGAMLVKRDIQQKVHRDLDKHQREYVLQQQLKAIQDELGGSAASKEADELRSKAKDKKWSRQAAAHFERELKKLEMMHPYSPEFPTQANYLKVMVELPWDHYSKDNLNIDNARTILDDDHFGLEEVKERILEHLSVMKLKKDSKSPILCLYGPPGVGKTSLGRSVARAMGREFARISLGGLHDEAEIRGHRKTYIGAMPGRIVQALRKCKCGNPVIVLDEIDKVGSDYRGDPSSALLEALDPEQNAAFYDNYLEMEYNLSRIMFLTTANNIAALQPALRDRMELIAVSGYTQEEKVQIAAHYLMPRLLTNHGLKQDNIRIGEDLIASIIDGYTSESGVRGLERQLSKIMRKTAKCIAVHEDMPADLTADRVKSMLGAPKFVRENALSDALVGVVTGMAWTQNGGEILFVEASISKGKGGLTTTGNLGDVMKESAALAFEYVKANASMLGIDADAFTDMNVHIHVPQGAIPKDGPSAGVAMATAIASVFSASRVRQDIAMTGEITLRGKVMPIGGVKEKILAAKRAGIASVLLPEENRRSVEEIKADYIAGLQIIYIKTIAQAVQMAVVR
jgi:ATP-dependent Lon protease